ncbi:MULTISPECIES: hypothetical protein [Rhizobium]|uniref:hypothetical protein n=1 Tax=Rhizobium TaxID=379 RepID=UPI0028ABB003
MGCNRTHRQVACACILSSLALSVTTLFAIPSEAEAADLLPAIAAQPEERDPDRLTFSIAPYLWIAGITGDTAVFGLPEVHSSESFGDILKDVDFGFMGAGEIRYGNFSVLTDLSYARVTSDSATPRGVFADSVDLKQETFTGMLGFGYTIIGDEESRLDAVVGAKLWWTETTISFRGGPLGGISRRDDATWVDGLAGFRGVYSITPEIYLTGWGLVGAGGADLDWDVMAGVGYKWKQSVSAVMGYRALGVNYSNGSLTNDIVQHGPMLGLVFRF